MNGRLLQSNDEACAVRAAACVFFRVRFIRHMDDVAGLLGYRGARLTAVRLIQTQMLLDRLRVWPINRHSPQRGFQQAPVGGIGPADHNPQGQPLRIHQQAALGAGFAPIGWVFAGLFTAQRRFGHRAIRRLPLPGNALEFVILAETGLPHALEDPRARPPLKVAMRRLARAEFLGQCVPLASGAQHIQDAAHEGAPISRRTPADVTPRSSPPAITRLRFRQQGFDPLPETIRQFPTGYVGVLRWRRLHRFRHARILLQQRV